ncbi:hypothetical protein FIA58_010250 [Flavobacterium jejuense]|uniref:Haemolysin activator HlyB C-terminal domain-containing protein n=1 Tax=Flavobacterium jejuense TaxID=1544455 RepID=A0ABX0IS66_9FLAO|nr:hypothetical protein [Flavobacterium jejuense]NHN26056.1 hypothetical protein [Flavobacterium jejuense]
MKKNYIILCLISCLFSQGQQFNLIIDGISAKDKETIDSITYIKKHKNVASIINQIKKFDSILNKAGFLESILKDQKKTNDSSFNYTYNIGNKTTKTRIITNNLTAEKKTILAINTDTLTIPFEETEKWILNKLQTLEKKGYSLAKLKLTNQEKKKNTLYSNLDIQLNSQRKTDALILLGYDKFPKNIKHQLEQKIKNRVFNQNFVSKIYNDLNSLTFITQLKYPEILFTENKTNIFAYINKSKPNKFDGYIGFSNDKNQKLVFNGYLDLLLINIFNSGEKFKIFWKNDGNQQTLFNLNTEQPYIFKTPLGIKSELNIFKQDSTFQNTQISLNLGYYFSFNQKTYIGFQNTTSVDIQNTNNQNLTNFKNQFYTITHEYKKNNNTNYLFPDKTNLQITIGAGTRNSNLKKNNQFFSKLELSHLITLNNKNNILLKNQTFYLNSKNYLTNELYRFGGINSIRGFRENSLQTNLLTSLITEYRYIITPNLSIHSILDYAYYEDKTTESKNKLLGLGIGFELLTNNGLLHFVYSNGSTEKQNIKLSNSIIQISFKTKF